MPPDVIHGWRLEQAFVTEMTQERHVVYAVL
jgi:hypothetical protein